MKRRPITAIRAAILSIATVLLLGTSASTMRGQIIVNSGNGLAEFSAYGLPVNTSLVTGLSVPQGIAVSGTNLFVANFYTGTIGEYSTSGAVLNTNLISGVSEPEGLAISGTNLFVANYGNGTIGSYTTSGATNKARFIIGVAPDGLAVSGSNLIVAGGAEVGEYTTSGAYVRDPLIADLAVPAGVASDGANLFVAQLGGNKISEYTLSGVPVNTNLISVTEPNGIAVSANLLFVVGVSGSVGEYTTDGATINASLCNVASGAPFGIVVAPEVGLAPANFSISQSPGNITLSWSTNAFAYQLQTSASLFHAVWSVVTNTPVVSNANYNISLSATNQTQFFRLRSIN